jgi:hypothetical protein
MKKNNEGNEEFLLNENNILKLTEYVSKVNKSDLKIFLKTRFEFNSGNVYISNSKIHGKGVFAKRDIKKNEIITLYPPDLLVYYPNENRHESGHIKNVIVSKDCKTIINNDKDFNSLMKYAYDVNTKYTIIGDPNNLDDPNYLGHMINDGYLLKSDDNKFDYLEKSVKSSNAIYKTIKEYVIVIEANKDINKGDEIFIMYGYYYWMTIGLEEKKSDKILGGSFNNSFDNSFDKSFQLKVKDSNRTCKNCSKPEFIDMEKHKKCSVCKITFYCSVKCQKDDWKKHKLICENKL